ncbi:MAG: mannose-1-phosphate guanylyltransferase [Gemmatimonadales bacterium]
MHWAVILAGGSGTRFWPLSTPSTPKQLLPLPGPGRSTAEEAVARLEGLIPRERILVVTGATLAGPLQDTLQLPRDNVMVEPLAASTAPALAWAAHEARRRDPDAVLLCLHADWHVPEPERFREAASRALDAAGAGALVTVGVRPTRAETGFGYIEVGPEVSPGVNRVARFKEKPTAVRAGELVASGALWNSGLFAWQGATLLEEVQAHTPELAPHLPLLDAGDIPGFFGAVTPISIDVGVLERSHRVVVVPGDFAWDDIGTWEALARVRPHDANGNVIAGSVHAAQTTNSIIWSDGTPVVTSGVHDLVIVVANGRVLVIHRDRAADLKAILEQLPPAIRDLEA